MADGPGPCGSDPWLAADALREVAEARRAAAASARPSPGPRAVQAVTLGAILAANAVAAAAWTPYLVIALPVLGLGLSRRAAGDRVQLNGLLIRGHSRVRAGATATVLAIIVLAGLGRLLWHWPSWTPLAGGIMVTALFYGTSRWFDLRVWRDWGGR
jgi:hypothetical protein